MESTITCSICQSQLADLVDALLTREQQQLVDQHIEHCEDCSQRLAQLWEMQAFASRWQDAPVPAMAWRQHFFQSESLLVRFQWVTSLASVLVLILVVSQAHISFKDGISFGQAVDTVNSADLSLAIQQSENAQQQFLDSRFAQLSDKQAASSQRLLKTMLSMSREERKAELTTLLTAWDYAQDQRVEQTDASIRLLLASQVEDKRDINQINRLLKKAVLEGSNL